MIHRSATAKKNARKNHGSAVATSVGIQFCVMNPPATANIIDKMHAQSNTWRILRPLKLLGPNMAYPVGLRRFKGSTALHC